MSSNTPRHASCYGNRYKLRPFLAFGSCAPLSLVRSKNAVDPRKPDGGAYNILTNVAKYTLAKLKGACMDGFGSTIGIYGFKGLKPQKFPNMPIR